MTLVFDVHAEQIGVRRCFVRFITIMIMIKSSYYCKGGVSGFWRLHARKIIFGKM